MQRIKIVNPKDDFVGTECYINDKKIGYVKLVDFRVAVDEVPTFIFETIGFPDIDMPGNVRFDFTPETVQQAVVVLRNELLKHGDFYNGFMASIESALGEQFEHTQVNLGYGCQHWIAEFILRRIIGEEKVQEY